MAWALNHVLGGKQKFKDVKSVRVGFQVLRKGWFSVQHQAKRLFGEKPLAIGFDFDSLIDHSEVLLINQTEISSNDSPRRPESGWYTFCSKTSPYHTHNYPQTDVLHPHPHPTHRVRQVTLPVSGSVPSPLVGLHYDPTPWRCKHLGQPMSPATKSSIDEHNEDHGGGKWDATLAKLKQWNSRFEGGPIRIIWEIDGALDK